MGRLQQSDVAMQHISAHFENFQSEQSIYFSISINQSSKIFMG